MGYSWALKVNYSIAFNWPDCDYELKNIHTYELDGPPRRIFNWSCAEVHAQLQDLYARSKTITKCTHSRRNPRFNCFVRDEFSIIMMNGWLKQCGWPADRCHRFPRVWPPCTGQPRHGRMMAGQWSERRRRNTILIDAPAREQLPQVATRLFGQMSTSTE